MVVAPSSATYRVEAEYDPHAVSLHWDARVYELHGADGDVLRQIVSGETRELAVAAATTWIRAENAPRRVPLLLFTDDAGNVIMEHAVRG